MAAKKSADGSKASVFSRASVPLPSSFPTIGGMGAAPSAPNVVERARRPVTGRAGLRALVPSAYSAAGETNEFLRQYKTKWLSKIDFTSESHVESLLILALMVLALDREAEAEFVTESLIKHVDPRVVRDDTRVVLASAMRLHAWLKSRRNVNAIALVARAKEVGRSAVHLDREWLSSDAANEIQDALERNRAHYLLPPLAGILYWINDTGARMKAESLLRVVLDAMRRFMQ